MTDLIENVEDATNIEKKMVRKPNYLRNPKQAEQAKKMFDTWVSTQFPSGVTKTDPLPDSISSIKMGAAMQGYPITRKQAREIKKGLQS